VPIAILRPTGAGTFTEWAVSPSGSNHAAVLAAGGAFVFASAAGSRDRYTFDLLPGTATAVTSVTAWTTATGDSASSTMRLTLRLAGVEDEGAAFVPLEGGYVPFSTAFPTAPGALAWTVARVNALEGGPDLIDTTLDFLACDEVWLAVDYETSVAAPSRPAQDIEFPVTGYREVSFGETPALDFPPTVHRDLDFPPSSALDIPVPGGASPPLEVDDGGGGD
jgi:hypothetical protein